VLIGAFIIIVIMTWALVIMNVRSVVQRFKKDKNSVRLYSYLTTLVVLGSLIIGVTSAVIQRVIDTEAFLRIDDTTAVRYYHR
jgi:hypothetical protein